MNAGTCIVVRDYVGEQLYAFDRATGGAERPRANSPPFGFGQWRTLGIFHGRRRVFIAVFIEGDEIVMSIGGREHCVTREGLTATIERRAFGLGREFDLSLDGEPRFSAVYWFPVDRGWPDDGDIFSLVHRIVSAKDCGRAFVRIWKATSEGRDVSSREFLDELAAASRGA